MEYPGFERYGKERCGSNVGIGVIRDLRGVLERDSALMAGLIVLADLGAVKLKNFHREMASAGDIEVAGRKYARMQILSVSEILDGKRFDTPGTVGKEPGK